MRMRVPKGKPVHEHLSTSYVKVGALLADLQVHDFTGYVQIGFRGYMAFVFLDSGSIIGAVEQVDTASRTGSEAIDGLLVRSEQRDGDVSIYEHPSATIQAISGIIDGQPIYTNLSSDFTDLDKLIKKLTKESGTTWYIEVVAEEGLGVGVAYILDGRADGVYSPLDSPTLEGADAIKTMLEVSEAFGATFNVYSVPLQVQVAPVAEPVGEAPPRLKVVGSTEPSAATQSATLSAAAPVATAVAADVVNEEEIAPLVRLLGEVVSSVEGVVSVRDGAGSFAIELRAGQLEVADRYPFLDPFAAEFEYHAGEIVFVGSVDPADFAAGLGEALHVTVAALSRRDGADGARFRQKVADAIAELYEARQAEFDAFGLAGLLVYVTTDDEPEVAAASGEQIS